MVSHHLGQLILSPNLPVKLVFAGLGMFCIFVSFRLLEHWLPRHFHERDVRYRVRKFVVFSGYVAAVLFLTVLFLDRLGRVGFALGVAGAGLVVALQDVIASLAGWIAIGFANFYKVGDRVQIGETRGDVIDVTFTRTMIVETGNGVANDLYNGRVARVPNSMVLKGTVYNYSQGFRYVWDEIKIVLTVDSDPIEARKMLLRVTCDEMAYYLDDALSSWSRVTDNFRIENVSITPTISLVVKNKTFEFTVSYVVDYANRTVMQDRLFTRIAQEVNATDGRLSWGSS